MISIQSSIRQIKKFVYKNKTNPRPNGRGFVTLCRLWRIFYRFNPRPYGRGFALSCNKLEVFFLVLIIGLASLVRLYNIRNTVVFLGDEGRDALAVKRIVLDLDPTLLGPTASVGGFYLGPIYYYMIAPFMVLFGMDPVGAAVFVALLGISTVFGIYWFVRRVFDAQSALTVSLLYAVSPGIIRFSRSSWNPNPMPFFVLITLITFYQALKLKRPRWFVLVGLFLGVIVQLHYLGLIVGGMIFLMTTILINYRRWLGVFSRQLLGFLVATSLFIAFEFRHNFLNSRAVLEFLSRGGSTTGPRNWNLLELFHEVNRFNFESVLGPWSKPSSPVLALLFVVSGIGLILWKLKKQGRKSFSLGEKIIILYWLIASFGLGSYRGHLHYHYFELMFPAPYLILGFILHQIKNQTLKINLIGISVLASLFLLTMSPSWEPGSRLIDQTERVADAVLELADGQPFNFALITPGNSDHAYRFFLEIKSEGPTPLEERVEDQLLIVCEKWPEDTCAPLGNPLWEIAGFGRAELVEQTEVYPRTTIYRMVHHPESIDKVGKPAK